MQKWKELVKKLFIVIFYNCHVGWFLQGPMADYGLRARNHLHYPPDNGCSLVQFLVPRGQFTAQDPVMQRKKGIFMPFSDANFVRTLLRAKKPSAGIFFAQ